MHSRIYNEDIESLIEKAKNGDDDAQRIIVEENIGLVWSAVRRFYNRGHETEDLFQIGCIGLIKAIKKFDTSFDVKFSTYAVPMIIGEIKRFIRDDGIIKVSRSVKELGIKAMAVREAMIKEKNAEPGVKEIAERLKVTPEELATALEAGIRPESIYSSAGDGESDRKALVDKIECGHDYENEIVNRVLVRELMDCFDEREKSIIVMRYFKQKTQAQIAEILGISQVQVSRLEKKVLTMMRNHISPDK